MIFVAIIPGYIWVALLLAGWATLTYLALSHLSIRHWAMTGLLVLMALQVFAGTSVAIATGLNPLSPFACLMGAYGTPVSAALSAVQTPIVLFLVTLSLRQSGERPRRFTTFVSIWFVFTLVAFLTHLRSATLCTV